MEIDAASLMRIDNVHIADGGLDQAGHTAAVGSLNASQITDTQMRCGAFTSVAVGYSGVELGAGALNTTVSGTASAGKCRIPPLQLILLDGPADPTTSLCNNSNALVAGCTGYQGGFASGQFYTQPAVSYGTFSVSGSVSATNLYAVPFFSPASGGTITRLALDVRSTGSASLCEVGLYNAAGGVPTTRIVDGGTINVTSTITSPVTLATPVRLAPQTLYFLAVGCNGTLKLEGAVNGVGALSTPLIGAPNLAATTTQIYASWTFMANSLPATFANGGAITSGPGSIPNVYAGP